MRRTAIVAGIAVALCLVPSVILTAAREAAAPVVESTTGKVALMSAGPLAFGPNGVLFVGDSAGGAIVSLDTGDTRAPGTAANIDIQGIDRKIAALLGVA